MHDFRTSFQLNLRIGVGSRLIFASWDTPMTKLLEQVGWLVELVGLCMLSSYEYLLVSVGFDLGHIVRVPRPFGQTSTAPWRTNLYEVRSKLFDCMLLLWAARQSPIGHSICPGYGCTLDFSRASVFSRASPGGRISFWDLTVSM